MVSKKIIYILTVSVQMLLGELYSPSDANLRKKISTAQQKRLRAKGIFVTRGPNRKQNAETNPIGTPSIKEQPAGRSAHRPADALCDSEPIQCTFIPADNPGLRIALPDGDIRNTEANPGKVAKKEDAPEQLSALQQKEANDREFIATKRSEEMKKFMNLNEFINQENIVRKEIVQQEQNKANQIVKNAFKDEEAKTRKSIIAERLAEMEAVQLSWQEDDERKQLSYGYNQIIKQKKEQMQREKERIKDQQNKATKKSLIDNEQACRDKIAQEEGDTRQTIRKPLQALAGMVQREKNTRKKIVSQKEIEQKEIDTQYQQEHYNLRINELAKSGLFKKKVDDKGNVDLVLIPAADWLTVSNKGHYSVGQRLDKARTLLRSEYLRETPSVNFILKAIEIIEIITLFLNDELPYRWEFNNNSEVLSGAILCISFIKRMEDELCRMENQSIIGVLNANQNLLPLANMCFDFCMKHCQYLQEKKIDPFDKEMTTICKDLTMRHFCNDSKNFNFVTDAIETINQVGTIFNEVFSGEDIKLKNTSVQRVFLLAIFKTIKTLNATKRSYFGDKRKTALKKGWDQYYKSIYNQWTKHQSSLQPR